MKIVITIAALVGLLAAQCPSNDQYCSKCSDKVCSICVASVLTGNTCVAPSTIISGCSTYLDKNICSDCMPGFYLTLDNKCTRITSAGCNTYSILDQCTFCDGGIKPVGGKCGTVTCSDKNCASCDKDDFCWFCKSGFSTNMTNGKCTTATSMDSNCYMNLNPGGCAACKFGYYDKDGVCTLSTAYKTASIILTAVVSIFGALFI